MALSPPIHLQKTGRSAHDGRMHPDYDHLQQAAKDHLWMHFTRHGQYLSLIHI